MDYAIEIKSRLSTKEVFLHYGFELNRAGAICCPFHSEKTASLKIYDDGRGWVCFGCHKGGDAINFVREYFGLNFHDAIVKINEDFSLGLPIGERISLRQRREMERQQRERKAEMERKQAEHDRLTAEYWAAFELWQQYDTNKREYTPKSPGEDFHPLFVEALQKIDGAEYDLRIAEMRLSGYENR